MPALAVLSVLLVLTACAQRFRTYDGVLGFSTTPLPGGALEARYIEQADRGWSDIEANVRAGCADALAIEPEAVILTAVTREEQVREIRFDVPITAAMGPSPQLGAVYNPGDARFNERVRRYLPVRVMTAQCAPTMR